MTTLVSETGLETGYCLMCNEWVYADLWGGKCSACASVNDPGDFPCYRMRDDDREWFCMNDHTGCLYNDGHNGCTAPNNMGKQPIDHLYNDDKPEEWAKREAWIQSHYDQDGNRRDF